MSYICPFICRPIYIGDWESDIFSLFSFEFKPVFFYLSQYPKIGLVLNDVPNKFITLCVNILVENKLFLYIVYK